MSENDLWFQKKQFMTVVKFHWVLFTSVLLRCSSVHKGLKVNWKLCKPSVNSQRRGVEAGCVFSSWTYVDCWITCLHVFSKMFFFWRWENALSLSDIQSLLSRKVRSVLIESHHVNYLMSHTSCFWINSFLALEDKKAAVTIIYCGRTAGKMEILYNFLCFRSHPVRDCNTQQKTEKLKLSHECGHCGYCCRAKCSFPMFVKCFSNRNLCDNLGPWTIPLDP